MVLSTKNWALVLRNLEHRHRKTFHHTSDDAVAANPDVGTLKLSIVNKTTNQIIEGLKNGLRMIEHRHVQAGHGTILLDQV